MRLTIQNKIQLAMQGLYASNELVGGTPDKFMLDAKEFGLLLLELHQQGKMGNRSISIKTKDDKSILMKIYREKITNKSVNDLIRMWVAKKFTIMYNDIPIVYDVPKSKEQAAKENTKKWQG